MFTVLRPLCFLYLLLLGVGTASAQLGGIPYAGGAPSMQQWMNAHLRYPSVAKEMGIQGRVVVVFTVTESGTIASIKVQRTAGWGLEEEAIRLLKQLPDKWLPAARKKHIQHALTFRFTCDGLAGAILLKQYKQKAKSILMDI